MAETGVIDLFVFSGPLPRDVVRQYTAVTGRPPLPQRFSTAYHQVRACAVQMLWGADETQCRWNYRDEADVKAVDAGFDTHGIPYDVLWLDIEHTDGKKYFTWDATLFPTPADMQRALAAHGRKMVTIIDPHIKRDSGYFVHSDALARGLYIKDAKADREYEGHCWPGASSWLDFSDAAVRQYWADQFAYDRYKGSTPTLYTWNDMNEVCAGLRGLSAC
jgi:alpha 1,3-glucosidase